MQLFSLFQVNLESNAEIPVLTVDSKEISEEKRIEIKLTPNKICNVGLSFPVSKIDSALKFMSSSFFIKK